MAGILVSLLVLGVLVVCFNRRGELGRPRAFRSISLIAALMIVAAVAPLAPSRQPIAQASTTSGAVFLRKVASAVLNDQTNSMSVGADAAGGMHAAFVNYSTDTHGDYHAYYDYCAPGQDCADASHWTLVNLMTVSSSVKIMEDAQLVLTTQGHPRVIIVTTDNGGDFKDRYTYAACDAGCTNSGNWTITEVANADLGANTFIFEGNKHYFALDPQNRPRFIVDNGSNYVYLYCDAACATDTNWHALQLNGTSGAGQGFNTAALAINSTGHPRMLAPLVDQITFATNLNYFECNTNDCATNANSWTAVPVISPVNTDAAAYSSLRLTKLDQPRFAIYGQIGPNETLFYFWCQSACTSHANWHFSSVGLVPAVDFYSSGKQPDLALDSQNEPRVSFQTLDPTLGNGLGYAWCNFSCESGGASWQKRLADPNSQLNSDWPRLPIAGCTYSSWIAGYRSALVLDKAGNPRIGYDALHFSGNCSDPSLNGSDYRTVRFVYFAGTTLPGPYRLYLPLLMR
jgi:hypothetical protein